MKTIKAWLLFFFLDSDLHDAPAKHLRELFWFVLGMTVILNALLAALMLLYLIFVFPVPSVWIWAYVFSAIPITLVWWKWGLPRMPN